MIVNNMSNISLAPVKRMRSNQHATSQLIPQDHNDDIKEWINNNHKLTSCLNLFSFNSKIKKPRNENSVSKDKLFSKCTSANLSKILKMRKIKKNLRTPININRRDGRRNKKAIFKTWDPYGSFTSNTSTIDIHDLSPIYK